MSGVETGATGNFWEAVPVPQGTYQGGPRGYHRVHAADWPASGQRQCIAGGATQQQQQRQHMHSVPWSSSAIDVSTYEGCVFTCAAAVTVCLIQSNTLSSVTISTHFLSLSTNMFSALEIVKTMLHCRNLQHLTYT